MRFSFILLFGFLFGSLNAEINSEKPFIVFLNGTSSAGKSSIAFQLQSMLHPSLHVGIDHFLIMMHPDYFGDGPLVSQGFSLIREKDEVTQIKVGPVGKQLAYAMHRSMKALIDNQFTLIIDECLIDDEAFKDYLELFREYKVYFIAVKPPLEVAIQWEKERGDRLIGLAKSQYPLVYNNKLFDLEIDSSLGSPKECAGKILEFIHNNPNPLSFGWNYER